jgi:hypothetical protein
MSREQPGSVERNVDVLVQLLQSGESLYGAESRVLIHQPLHLPIPPFTLPFPLPDEPREVAVVKTALIQHLELDSKGTLSVLCDQIVHSDDPIEDEDKLIRERLRRLVIAFLAEDAREPLLSRLQSQGDSGVEQEQALIDTLLKVN